MTAFKSKRIGVTAAALLIAAGLVGANASAANASYISAPTLSVDDTSLTPGQTLFVHVSNTPDTTFTVTFNGVKTSNNADPSFAAPTKAGSYSVVLSSSAGSSSITVTEGTILTAISVNHTAVTHNKAFLTSGHISSPIAGVAVTLEGAGVNGVFKVIGHGTTDSSGQYIISATFTGKGSHFLRAITTASAAVNSVTGTSAKFTVN
jgi:hypothetical protein